MSAGLQIHKQAVLIEYYLNQAVNKVKGRKDSTLADITMVYDQPIRLTAEILSELQEESRDRSDMQTIQDIKKKYCVYHGYILSQLDEEVCTALCEDLKQFSEH